MSLLFARLFLRLVLILGWLAGASASTTWATEQCFSDVAEAVIVEKAWIPNDIITQDAPLTSYSKEYAAIRKGKTYSYFIDIDGVLRLSETPLVMPERGALHVIRDSKTGRTFVSRESGELRFDPKTGRPILDKKSKGDIGGDPEDVIAHLKKKYPEIEVARPRLKKEELTKVMTCSDITSAKSSNLQILIGQLIMPNVIDGGAILAVNATDLVTGETPPLLTDQGQQIAASNLAITNVGSVVGGTLGFGLGKYSSGFAGYMLVSTLMSTGMPYVGKEIREGMVDPAYLGENSSEEYATWDKVYGLGRIPASAGFEYFMRNKLPNLIFSACIKGAKLKFYYNAGFLRIVEQGGLSLIYYGGQRAWAGPKQPTEPQQH